MVFFAFSMYRKLDGMPTCAWRSSSRAERKWEHKLCAHFDLPSLGFLFLIIVQGACGSFISVGRGIAGMCGSWI